MNLILVTPAAGLPVSAEDVAEHCRIDAPTASDTALVVTYIAAAASWAFGLGGWTGRSLLNESFAETFDGWCRTLRGAVRYELPLSRAIVQSITGIEYVDSDGATQILAADQYRLVHRHGAGLVVPAYEVSWPALRAQEQPVIVTYVAGYGAAEDDIPADLRTLLMQLSAWMWENRTMTVPDGFTAAFRKFQVNWSV